MHWSHGHLVKKAVELALVLRRQRIAFTEAGNGIQQEALGGPVSMFEIFSQNLDKMFHAVPELARVGVLDCELVTNIEETTESIRRAMKEAELMAGVTVDRVYAGIAGAHIDARTSLGIVAVGDDEIAPGQHIGRILPERRGARGAPVKLVPIGRQHEPVARMGLVGEQDQTHGNVESFTCRKRG